MDIKRDETRKEDIQKSHNSLNLRKIGAFHISSNDKDAYVYLRSLNNFLTLFPPLRYFVCDKPAPDPRQTSNRRNLLDFPSRFPFFTRYETLERHCSPDLPCFSSEFQISSISINDSRYRTKVVICLNVTRRGFANTSETRGIDENVERFN
jgi:hypothetical protein